MSRVVQIQKQYRTYKLRLLDEEKDIFNTENNTKYDPECQSQVSRNPPRVPLIPVGDVAKNFSHPSLSQCLNKKKSIITLVFG